MTNKSYFILSFFSLFLLLLVYTNNPIQLFTLVIEIEKNEDDTCKNTAIKIKNLIKTFGSIKPTNISINNKKNEFKLENEWIVDKYYQDFIANENKTIEINNEKIESIIQLIARKSIYNSYDDLLLEKILDKINLNGKRIAILSWFESNYEPWIEALLQYKGAKDITTIDLNRKNYENYIIKSLHITKYNLENKFDIIISHYSLETIGLGKFGEHIDLNADKETLKFINCMLEPFGMLFLTLSISNDRLDSSLQFNTKRIYGKKRLDKLFNKNWVVLDSLLNNHGSNEIFLLKKIN